MMLGEFLKAVAADPAPWNCSTMPADWCVARGHPDFSAAWRDVTDEDACAQYAGADLLELWNEGIGEALPSFTPTGTANMEAGDIALVSALGLTAGAIWTGQRFAIRAPRGLHFLDPAALVILEAWRP